MGWKALILWAKFELNSARGHEICLRRSGSHFLSHEPRVNDLLTMKQLLLLNRN
jgi:hypothetical protein